MEASSVSQGITIVTQILLASDYMLFASKHHLPFRFHHNRRASVFSVPAFVSSDCKGHECVNLELRNGLPAPSGQCWEIPLTVQCGRWTAGAFSILRPPPGTYNESGPAGELTWHSAMRGEFARGRGDEDRQIG